MSFRKSLLLFFILCPCLSFAQIKVRSVKAPITEEPTEVKYDSTKNFLGEKTTLYVGQELYVNGIRSNLQKFGYNGFYLDYNKRSQDDLDKLSNTYKVLPTENEYLTSEGQGVGRSVYDSLYGKYFIVNDIVEPKDFPLNRHFLKLIEKKSRDTVYFLYNPLAEYSFPFIVVGYLEKTKKDFSGKKLVFKASAIEGEADINTGKVIPKKIGETWFFQDMVVQDDTFTLSLIFKNAAGNEIAIAAADLPTRPHFPLQKAAKYKAKFGSSRWNDILNEEVSIGMTKEMAKLAWGEPDDINTTITSSLNSEQWVYSENYLYFDNGKLTAIQ